MRERRVEAMEEEDGGAVCFIKASVTPQSTADKTRLSNGNSSSMRTYLLSLCNMDCAQIWIVWPESLQGKCTLTGKMHFYFVSDNLNEDSRTISSLSQGSAN